ncbi:MAG: hypothetical protein GY703_20445 [Gammaproteobacteria bacterium]|nr:hypothetical protein [Gammaproteobacteria bacterium]
MNSRNFSKLHYLVAVVFCLTLSFGQTQAAKVSLDPSNWGSEAGASCLDCHRKASPGIATQWHDSAHGAAGVNCLDCHRADPADDDAMEHEGEVIAIIVSPKDCGHCHSTEFKQQQGSVHTDTLARMEHLIPTLTGTRGNSPAVSTGCSQCHGSRVEVRGDGTLAPDTWPNSGIGRINPDGSKGSCSACHNRHGFSRAAAREPGGCTGCHSGADSPDREVYAASSHGRLFASNKDRMNLDSDQWVAGRDYAAAPTCVTCHMGAAPGLKGTHDVGLREAWALNTPVSEKQSLIVFKDGDKREWPASRNPPRRGADFPKADGTIGKIKAVASPKTRRKIMTRVCLECHGKGFTTAAMRSFDALVKQYNTQYGEPARAIMQALYEKNLLTPLPFDEKLETTYWELWHDHGTRARHGAAMQSPNDTWWEGIHRVNRTFHDHFLPQVRGVAGDEITEALIREHLGQDTETGQSSSTEPFLGYGEGKTGHE